MDLKQAVLDIIERHQGVANSIKGREIAAELGLSDDRVVQIAIEHLIGTGHVIAASVKADKRTGQRMGYFIPITYLEEEDYKHQLRSRAIGNFRRYKRFKTACANRRQQATAMRMF